ncbi:DUF305-containing protein [Fragilaria crotonensis]|nr:DUF305-containing protein [Fragilaria crotonensis]
MKLLISVSLLLAVRAEDKPLCLPDCSSGTCVFDVSVRLSAGQLGYFKVEGCGGVNPTLGLEIGVTHTFLQTHDHNYYHPLGFAYFPDGDHAGLEELEPGIPPPDSGSDCAETMTCPAPMYFLNGQYLGFYSNDPDVLKPTTNKTYFGLDDYEPVFYYPYDQWLGLGKFSVNLRFDQVYDKDIFYFCHIHQYMSGRIKLLQNGVPVQPDEDLPEIPYKYNHPTEYDETCGSFGLTDFQLPNPQCPDRFVCDAPSDGTIGQFAACIEAQNCQMFMGMTTGVSAQSVAALFMHQMIPHHVNAVHMAKTLLLHGEVDCDEFDPEDPGCTMYAMGLSIVNSQNFQIQKMTELLELYGFPESDDCVVPVSGRVDERERQVRRLTGGYTGEKSGNASKDTMEGVSERPKSRDSDIATQRILDEGESNICISTTGTYTVRVNLYAGELGYFTFDECGDQINPTIGIEIGDTYTFEQFDRSNYFHPLGFAYFADGDHAGLDELEPGIQPHGSDSSCAADLTCPAPMYLKDGDVLGTYSNNPDLLAATMWQGNFGLDDYEPLFYRPIPEWSASKFSISLKFDVDDFDRDLFYFCHIHQFMSGRIKLLKNGVPVTKEDVPELPYEYDAPGEFDAQCGSFGLDDYQLPNDQCFDRYVCGAPDDDSSLGLYSRCIEAMNCRMIAGVTTKATSMSGVALFIHHMVPHHQNAVNMAKSTLKLAGLECDDLTGDSNDCVLEQILREIVNGQNREIQLMYGVLEKLGFPKTDDCMVKMEQHSADDGHDVVVEVSNASTNANADMDNHESTNGGTSVEGMHKKAGESPKGMQMRGASLKGSSTAEKSSKSTKDVTSSKMKGMSARAKSGETPSSSKMAMPSSKMKGKKS